MQKNKNLNCYKVNKICRDSRKIMIGKVKKYQERVQNFSLTRKRITKHVWLNLTKKSIDLNYAGSININAVTINFRKWTTIKITKK